MKLVLPLISALGTNIRYTLFRTDKLAGFVGAGLAFMASRHTYRELLDVDFTELFEPQSIVEEFTTVKKNVLG